MESEDKKLKKVLIWLAGIISTDGSVLNNGNGLAYRVYSVELEWIKHIHKILSSVGLKSNIWTHQNNGGPYYILYINKPRVITELLRKHGLKTWMMSRKWDRLDGKYRIRHYTGYTDDECDIILNEYKPASKYGKNACLKSIKTLSKRLGRTELGIRQKAKGLSGLYAKNM